MSVHEATEQQKKVNEGLVKRLGAAMKARARGAHLRIFVPPELEGQRADLQRFFDAMIYKLRKNAHKGRWPDQDLKGILKKLREEVAELAAAIKEGSSSEILMEAADVANFALITANIALEAKGV